MRSTNSKQTMAVATGTLVVRGQQTSDEDVEKIRSSFERELRGKHILRPLGPITIRRSDTVVELRCDVEYGPVFGCYETDIRRQLASMKLDGENLESNVFNFKRREVTPADLPELEMRAEDINLPLDARKNLSDMLVRLRERSTQ